MNQLIETAQQIRCLITDLDGVLTNGLVYIDNNGNELKGFHIQDGLGLKLLMAVDIHVAVITASRNKLVEHRMQQLGITHYITNQIDKRRAFQELKKQLGLSNHQIAYIGDDLPDLPIIQEAGLGVAVANAVPQIKEFAMLVTEKSGGAGAVREVCDLILTAQGKATLAYERFIAT